VLSATTGHVHDGAVDGGNKIEGTVLKSTGATAGYILTAGAGGTATTWQAPAVTVGVFSSSTAVVSGFQATAGTITYLNSDLAGGTGVTKIATAASGSRFTMISSAANTGNGTARYWNLGTAATAGSVNITPVVAGTTFYVKVDGTGFDTGSSGYAFVERNQATTTGNRTLTVRRYTDTLATNSWNCTIASNVSSANYSNWTTAPFTTGVFWEPTMKIWWGFSNSDVLGTARLYVINDSTGTLYTANAYVVTAGTFVSGVLVPPATAAGTGTIYVYQTSVGVAGWATYSVTATSITAIGTSVTFPTTDTTPEDAFLWNSAGSVVQYIGNNGNQIFNSSFTALQNNTASTSLNPWEMLIGGKYESTRRLGVDQTTDSPSLGTATIYLVPNYDAGGTNVFTSINAFQTQKGKDVYLMGSGSATYMLYLEDAIGTAISQQLTGIGTAVFTASTAGRVWNTPTGVTAIQTRQPTASVGGVTYLGAGSVVAVVVGTATGTATATTISLA